MTAYPVTRRLGVIVDFDGVVARSTGIKYDLLLESARSVGMTDVGPLVAALDSELNGADRARVGRWVADRLGRPVAAGSFVEHFTHAFAAQSKDIDAIAGFGEFVSAMRRSDIQVCVVSLAPATEITQWLGSVVDTTSFTGIFGIEHGHKQTTTRLALDRIGVVEEPVICIGDTPADLVAATGAGCRFIRMRSQVGDRCDWTGTDVPTASSFTDVLAILAAEPGWLR